MNNRGFGRACFALLGLFAVTRVAVAFLPAGPWSPSGYQCGSYYLLLPSGSSHSCTADAAFGEGARVSNRLEFVEYRREKFTIDARGYRNLPVSGTPSVILFGSSFSLGLSLNDEETISTQLSRMTGVRIYNASNVLNTALSAEPILRAAQAIHVDKGLVLLEILNREPYSYANQARRESKAPFQSIERRIRNPFAITRVSSLVSMRLQNDRLFPNPDKFRFPEEELNNGRPMLFYAPDKNFFGQPADPGLTVAAVAQLRDQLQHRGFRLAVILVPTGYTVYYPLLRRQDGADNGNQYMAALAVQLKASGIPVFNCLPDLRHAAEGQQIYWPDDAHWNPRGVQVAARALAPWLRSLTDAVQ